ncbi:MAG: helix-turn-helix domain-containing protein [Methanomassiliicoccales archaeon]|nr:helix-turn-helix domain-containing protein [Methanomassiliicoccales archaeon]NYT15068.1 helix-turn-helix domain-containing protein [Methanomassiliicoccales archaeon]
MSTAFSKISFLPQLPELSKIREIRKKLNLSQRELASKAGVSQSLIAKIESGSIDPSFIKVKQIFDAFEEEIRRQKVEGKGLGEQLTVYDLATKGVISVSPNQTIGEVVDRMVKGRFTQLPVMDGERVVGAITDDRIRGYTIDETRSGSKTYDEVMETPISEIMEPPFSILNDDTSIELASLHLQREEAVLVSRKGVIVGILTSADFLDLGLRY